MKRKLCVGLVLFSAAAAIHAQSGIKVTIDGQPMQFDGSGPQMIGGRVLVPLRGIFERLGAYVEWNAAQHSIYASRGQDKVQLQIGSTSATVDGRAVTLDVPAQIVEGSTLVPIRFVSESVGAQVSWSDAEQTVVINSNQPPPTEATPPSDDDQAPSSGEGPVRLARFSLVGGGGVTWRPSDDAGWSGAADNQPIREGAEIWVDAGSRAEVQFDDGSFLRLGNGAVATLQTMFSDDRGEFTEIRLNNGSATLRLTSSLSKYQIDTPLASVISSGRSDFRVDDSSGLRVVVRSGQANVQGANGQVTLMGRDYLRLADANSVYAVGPAPGEDPWDQSWNSRNAAYLHPSPYLPSNIALVAGDLNSSGTWVNVPPYGYCWRPNVSDPNWAPYHSGHWVWVNPFGWTWCANESWGWAPYHYGTWASTPQGWAWCPGPAQQYWSPAVVHFSTYNGSIAWCPLAPAEVHYPAAISLGFRSGNWSLNFSIGGAACYYPAGPNYCAAQPWNNRTVNRNSVFNVTNVTNIQNVYVTNTFVPRNSRVQGGATVTSTAGFAGTANFSHGNAATSVIFTKGQAFARPAGGSPRFAGPTSVKPTVASFTASRSFVAASPSRAILTRQVVRAPLPSRFANAAPSMANSRVLPRVAPVAAQNTRRPGAVPPNTRSGSTVRSKPGALTSPAPRKNPLPNVPANPRRPTRPNLGTPAPPVPRVPPPSIKPPRRPSEMPVPAGGPSSPPRARKTQHVKPPPKNKGAKPPTKPRQKDKDKKPIDQ